MPRNVEIKARIADIATLARSAEALATQAPIEITQDDTFFRCQTGRLKLRAFSAQAGELIFYQRANDLGPKESFYVISQVPDPDTLREALRLALGQIGRVIKHRTLFLLGRTRLHLDRVEGLGHFMELEVVLEEGEPTSYGAEEARLLMTQLGVDPERLVETAYIDLLTTARD
jgi:predicted adenylyl cyclase CyaB